MKERTTHGIVRRDAERHARSAYSMEPCNRLLLSYIWTQLFAHEGSSSTCIATPGGVAARSAASRKNCACRSPPTPASASETTPPCARVSLTTMRGYRVVNWYGSNAKGSSQPAPSTRSKSKAVLSLTRSRRASRLPSGKRTAQLTTPSVSPPPGSGTASSLARASCALDARRPAASRGRVV